ncbi:MAG: TetR/AcrR family transcriptional regulator [Gammaproteobacteria bacterium]|nr:TetR/AcrR family transcriptional regulator [Gammaproteobacteria bacterium]MDH4311214.1 TetR/AcrR family transcriptional regulator [Gammaproteobacteria bacterium]MDH5273566.1 TetR/AcrR family transcriptional regulator [Gammaproteobacteria bacterium]
MIGRTASASKDKPRAEVQRERILCAAQKCFIEHGFHAASMANIAAAAQMSAGLMYRYFENKSAIVKAIVERQLQDGRAQIEQLHTSADLVASILQTYRLWLTRDPSVMNPALYLEMSAEATRDPQIAAALQESDERIYEALQAWMARGRDDRGLGLPPDIASRRTHLLMQVWNGLAVSAVRRPNQDPAAMRDVIEQFVNRLVAP